MKNQKNLGKILRSISKSPIKPRAYRQPLKREEYVLTHLGPGSYIAYGSMGNVRSANLL